MNQPSNNFLTAVLKNKCPRCRQGNLFLNKNPYKLKDGLLMHEKCLVCGQPTEIEVGFYYGTGYLSYAISFAFLVATMVAWAVIFGLSFKDNSIFEWLITACILLVMLQPILMRLSRTLWLSFFVKYDANWKNNPVDKPERFIK
ncbi:MAG TPA: DUF983 domain-containing protein [Chitinophagaceae bacterium]|nr:DUF983 domain-containing protein [Chitinophagaceae bacterium]MCC6635987.1 DUF983 domain-containing protein [Chitinophagaceae bacterium]HMZ46537.1 DUF983 domain-containing protein [Chitinophagaceae bacterium]HNE92543.1 DUF983 domain-containing protein [Chitinophagaceae bacterium]HNF29381.1 DUF983 domain-containing protein [Chitinophagaceae bacterium]